MNKNFSEILKVKKSNGKAITFTNGKINYVVYDSCNLEPGSFYLVSGVSCPSLTDDYRVLAKDTIMEVC